MLYFNSQINDVGQNINWNSKMIYCENTYILIIIIVVDAAIVSIAQNYFLLYDGCCCCYRVKIITQKN